jgi:hypothetical protein
MFRTTQPHGHVIHTAEKKDENAYEERHYSVNELSVMWNLSKQTVRRLFQDEPGVLRISEEEAHHKRGYVTLRIPESVARRVHQRLAKSA